MHLKYLNDVFLSRLPFCAVCERPVESISFRTQSFRRLVRFCVFCHGEVDEFTISYDSLEFGNKPLSQYTVFKPKQKEEKVEVKQIEPNFSNVNTLRRIRI